MAPVRRTLGPRDVTSPVMLHPDADAIDLSAVLSAFAEQGYARLGRALTEGSAAQLASRAEVLMQAEVDGVFYQHDSDSGHFKDLVFNAGWVGPSTRYRKLERLECDPLFAKWIGNPLFERIARELLVPPIQLYRSVLWNKAPHVGMAVPWHQDDGRFWGLNRPPFLQIWTALDDAPVEAGCLEVVPGSHKAGLASPEGGTITAEYLKAADDGAIALPAVAGESILVHNHTWHRTGRNRTAKPRRALSVSLLDGDTGCTRRRRAPRAFQRLF
jgi:phytanoyl-CoA hydroxylase